MTGVAAGFLMRPVSRDEADAIIVLCQAVFSASPMTKTGKVTIKTAV